MSEVETRARELLWAGMIEEIGTWPRGFDAATDVRPDGDDYSNYRGDMVAGGALRIITAVLADRGQIERDTFERAAQVADEQAAEAHERADASKGGFGLAATFHAQRAGAIEGVANAIRNLVKETPRG